MAENIISIEEAKKDLLSCATYLAEAIKSREARAAAIQTVVTYYLEKGDVDTAAALADGLDDPFVRDGLLVKVIGKCVDIDDEDYAFQLVEAIEEPRAQATALESISLKKAAKGDFVKAVEIAEKLEHSSNAFAGIAVSQTNVGEQLLAMQTLERVDFYNSKVDGLQEIAFNYLRKDELEKGVEMLDKATLEAVHIEFAEDKIRAMLGISSNFMEAKADDKAIEILGKVRDIVANLDGVHKDELFVQVAIGFLKAGSVDLADMTLDLVSDKTQIADCLLGFSHVFLGDKEIEEALEALEEAYAILNSQTEKEIQNSQARFQLFGAIASQFAQLEKIERGIELAHENPNLEQKSQALMRIAQICVLRGKDEMARQTVKGLEDSQKMSAILAISDAKNSMDETEDALKFLIEASEMLDTIPQMMVRSDIQQEIAERFHAYNDQDSARDLVTKNLLTISEIPGDGNKAISLAELSRLFSKFDFELSATEKETLSSFVQSSEW